MIDGSNNNIDGSGIIILLKRRTEVIDEAKNVTLDVEVGIRGILLSGQVTTNEQVQLKSRRLLKKFISEFENQY